MTGRFFTPIIFVAAVLFSELTMKRVHILSISCFVVLISLPKISSIMDSPRDNMFAEGGGFGINNTVKSERSFYYPTTGLLNYSGNRNYEQQEFYTNSMQDYDSSVILNVSNGSKGSLGFVRFAVSQKAHIVDGFALGDAFLARLPAIYNPGFRTGHLRRYIPMGYLETIESGENMIANYELRQYYDVLRNIISGSIFSAERFEQIIDFNMGKYDYLINKDGYRYTSLQRFFQNKSAVMSFEDFTNPGTSYSIDSNGVQIMLDRRTYKNVNIYLEAGRYYDIAFLMDNQVVAIKRKDIIPGEGLICFPIELSKKELKSGYDSIVVVPADLRDVQGFPLESENGNFSVGAIEFR